MIWGSITGFIMMLGFAYIIWALAQKDETNSKVWGQIIAGLVLAAAIITIILGVTGYGHRGKMMKWTEQQRMMQQVK